MTSQTIEKESTCRFMEAFCDLSALDWIRGEHGLTKAKKSIT